MCVTISTTAIAGVSAGHIFKPPGPGPCPAKSSRLHLGPSSAVNGKGLGFAARILPLRSSDQTAFLCKMQCSADRRPSRPNHSLPSHGPGEKCPCAARLCKLGSLPDDTPRDGKNYLSLPSSHTSHSSWLPQSASLPRVCGEGENRRGPPVSAGPACRPVDPAASPRPGVNPAVPGHPARSPRWPPGPPRPRRPPRPAPGS